ncbi:MAG: hypothetical protein ACI8Z1_001732 [Candidatus Azotimanducaceae bacterium]|jgi:hypothetical protein
MAIPVILSVPTGSYHNAKRRNRDGPIDVTADVRIEARKKAPELRVAPRIADSDKTMAPLTLDQLGTGK